MIFHPPSEDYPYQVAAHGDLSVGGLTSLAAIDAALDRLDALRRGVDGGVYPDGHVENEMWVVCVVPTFVTTLPFEERLDVPTMDVGVGSDRVPVHWDHEEGGHNATARSERPEDAEDRTELTYRTGGDWGWTTPAELVPADAAREAVRQWLTTGRRPTNIAWEDL
ncbi:Imm1 family immunity protein [Kineococcus rhizosphaerae]|uniref:Immunity protein Imm1 of predicted polymorphic toxin system n=1 Tax=Kineococcus rhizosphaerae TaxID=559628 RepID=A0A2T0R862_9ACTN|nr:Imm1 family immunity protein [Kineococcus rhizosphaerae]PRY17351.1 immunity protein Imm1 of predicted polymorphic toxin system [Kineococcus rhizosphaerae]